MNERKEPRLGSIEPLDTPSRIPTLTELATPEIGGDGIFASESANEDAARTPAMLPIVDENIEALADRVLDRIAPVLREAVAAAIAELLAERELPRR